jgi:hypothetical protein
MDKAVKSHRESGRSVTVKLRADTLTLAMERSGFADPAELVEFALRLLIAPDPSADFARASRGSLPDFDLTI